VKYGDKLHIFVATMLCAFSAHMDGEGVLKSSLKIESVMGTQNRRTNTVTIPTLAEYLKEVGPVPAERLFASQVSTEPPTAVC
jgi:hypothetical protein